MDSTKKAENNICCRIWRNWNLCPLLIGALNGLATREIA
jgi:hypothetical protein